jgi:thiol-disulfide isomerase/thioredoxin
MRKRLRRPPPTGRGEESKMRHRSRRIAPGIALAAAALLVAAACSSDSPGDASAEEPSDGSAGSFDDSFTFVVTQGESELGASAGEEVEFASLVGQGTPLVLNFWAGLCPPCRTEMPWFQSAVDEFGDEVLKVGIDIGPFVNLGSNDDGLELLDELGITYPTGVAVDAEPVRNFDVFAMPTTVFIDGDGEILENHGGILVESQIHDAFAQLAAEAG